MTTEEQRRILAAVRTVNIRTGKRYCANDLTTYTFPTNGQGVGVHLDNHVGTGADSQSAILALLQSFAN